MTYFLATGRSLRQACEEAGPHGAAVLTGPLPVAAQKPLGC